VRERTQEEFSVEVTKPDAARQAQSTWSRRSIAARLEVIRRFRHLLVEQAELIAHAANVDHRRPVSEILASEILPLADACKFLEREAGRILAPRKLGWRGRALWLGGVSSEIRREPFGVILSIAPSNYPIFLPGVQVVQALAAGNAVVLKPGPAGLSAALQLARLLHVAGLPDGLLRVLPESAEAAQAAIASGVDKVFFTGSASTGKSVLAQLAPLAVPAVMELSGSDAVIIRVDADLDLAVRALTFGLRLNAGQTCIAPRRVLVARSVATEFEGRLARALAKCAPAEFSPAQSAKLTPLVRAALTQGAHLLAGEVSADAPLLGPLVLAGVSPDAPLIQEDIFGPLMGVMTVASDEEAICIANSSAYALGATIFSRDESAAQALAAQISAGVVLINDLIAPTADARLPFGGRKLSGFGSTRGREGLLEMTTQKVVMVNCSRRRPHFDEPQSWHEGLFLAFLKLIHGRDWRTRFAALKNLVSGLRQSNKQN